MEFRLVLCLALPAGDGRNGRTGIKRVPAIGAFPVILRFTSGLLNLDAMMALLQSDEGMAAEEHDGILAETVVIFIEG